MCTCQVEINVKVKVLLEPPTAAYAHVCGGEGRVFLVAPNLPFRQELFSFTLWDGLAGRGREIFASLLLFLELVQYEYRQR